MSKSNGKGRKKINKHDIFEKNFVKSVKEVKNPIRNSLIIAGLWFFVILILVIVIAFFNNHSIIWNINFGFSAIFGISIIWAMGRFGVLESMSLKFKNWRNSKLVKSLKLKSDIKLSLEDYRKLQKRKSWYGVLALLIFGLFGLIITLIIMYT